MSSYQPATSHVNFYLPVLRMRNSLSKFFLKTKTKRVLRQLSAEQLKDIGLYRDTKYLSSTLTRQLW